MQRFVAAVGCGLSPELSVRYTTHMLGKEAVAGNAHSSVHDRELSWDNRSLEVSPSVALGRSEEQVHTAHTEGLSG